MQLVCGVARLVSTTLVIAEMSSGLDFCLVSHLAAGCNVREALLKDVPIARVLRVAGWRLLLSVWGWDTPSNDSG